MIHIEQLSFTYEHASKKALDDVSLDVERGDFLGIIGESGAGKSTLGHCINGVVPHHFHGDYYGHVTVCEKDTFQMELTDISRIIGTVSQDVDSSMVAAIVEDELLYGLENFGIPHEEIEERIDRTLEEVGIASLRHRRIATLSGGQKQKVALAAIIALRPDVVLLDEPTAELDPISSRQIFELLKRLNEHGVTVIIIEQKVMLLAEFAKHILVLEHGHVALQGTTQEVLHHIDRMQELGINCPRVSLMSSKLNKRGIGTGNIVATVPQAREFVKEVLA